MARKKKNDFWDDDVIETQSDDTIVTPKKDDQEEWSAIKSLPLKILMRFLLMVTCFIALGSAYIAYSYVGDRYASGSYSHDFYQSESFAKEYNKQVDQVLALIDALEADPTVTQVGNEQMLTTLVENYVGKDTNFAFLIQDREHFMIAQSDENAKTRIESSNYYAMLANVAEEAEFKSTISSSMLHSEEWIKALSDTNNNYIIYTAVDNELTQSDAFYQAKMSFDKMEEYFSIARFAGIIGAVLFIICLIFCIMSTGMKRGEDSVCLSWFDRILTEPALIWMIGGAGALIYADYRLWQMQGSMYFYAAVALLLVIYIWVIRSYFSIVRRMKAGQLFRHSIIGIIVGGIAKGIAKLPTPFNYIVGGLLMLAFNAGLVAAVIFFRHITVKGIPVMYVIAPIVLIIELFALLTQGNDDEEDETEEDEEENVAELIKNQLKQETIQETAPVEEKTSSEIVNDASNQDWEVMDLSRAIAEAEQKQMLKNQEEQIPELVQNEKSVTKEMPTVKNNQTVMISSDEIRKALEEAGIKETETVAAEAQTVAQAEEFIPEEPVQEAVKKEQPVVLEKEAEQEVKIEEKVNLTQMNKDVRKKFKARLKARGISVTVRAPERAITPDLDKNSLMMIVENIFEQIEALVKDEERVYVEIYVQGDKVVYILKMNVAEHKMAALETQTQREACFNHAQKITEAYDGKFALSLDQQALRVGMMLDLAK